MCAVVGYCPIRPTTETTPAFERLFLESRIRGLHAFGIAQPRGAAPAVLRTFDLEAIPAAFDRERPAVAHARYSTSGDWHDHANNQPVVLGDMALALNGVLHQGTKAEFEEAFSVQCASDNDAEVFLRRLAAGQSAREFIREVRGSMAAVWLVGSTLYAARNEWRPLWACEAYGARWYASTSDILRRAGFPLTNARAVLPHCVECAA